VELLNFLKFIWLIFSDIIQLILLIFLHYFELLLDDLHEIVEAALAVADHAGHVDLTAPYGLQLGLVLGDCVRYFPEKLGEVLYYHCLDFLETVILDQVLVHLVDLGYALVILLNTGRQV
jgi:hypothetical protein